ncbi:MAG: 4Fe-4S dicluster domain-containing protein [Methanotrichaceae archaeon]|nr:4Fe-4S dicluster domain-containing protein [Methanotrichaceae archaeon]
MIAFLPKENLSALLSRLSGKLEVVAAVRTESGPVFSTWRGQSLDLERNSEVSPTEFLLPQKDVLFRYIQYSGRYVFEVEEPKSKLIMGVRPCDLKAIRVLDKIFGSEPADNSYIRKRRSLILAVLNCNHPGEACFCSQLGSGPECQDGFDLLLTEIDSGYLVESGSSSGTLILKDYSESFQDAGSNHIDEKTRKMDEARKIMEARQNRSPENILNAIEKADWEALGGQCLNCGGCTFVCPVCHCFNIIDLGVPDGERLRCRDSCILSGFSRMTGNVNPRKSAGERLRNWYLDKFQYIPENTGLLGCVGCGRCSQVCLAHLDKWNFGVLE